MVIMLKYSLAKYNNAIIYNSICNEYQRKPPSYTASRFSKGLLQADWYTLIEQSDNNWAHTYTNTTQRIVTGK